MTCDTVWSPSRYDSTPSSNDSWFQENTSPAPLHSDFGFFGEHIQANLTDALSPSLLSLLRRTGLVLGDFHIFDNLHRYVVIPGHPPYLTLRARFKNYFDI